MSASDTPSTLTTPPPPMQAPLSPVSTANGAVPSPHGVANGRPNLLAARTPKLQSCQPCRISKLRCSHEQPCARCHRLGRADQCVYVLPRRRSANAASKPFRTIAKANGMPIEPHRGSVEAFNPLTLQTGGVLGYSRQPLRFSQDFIGPTAQTAILEEVKADLGTIEENEVQQDDELKMWSFDSKGRRFCEAILAWLPSQAVSKELFDWFDGTYGGCLPQKWVMKHFHDAFWATYGHHLQEPRTAERMGACVADIVRSTKQHLAVPATNAEFLNSFSGRQTRWEMLGELFCLYGYAGCFMQDGNPIGLKLIPPNTSRKSFSCSMLECADACLLLCDELNSSGSNVLAVSLLSRCVNLQSVVTGDSNYELWKRCGQSVNATTGLGLHRSLVHKGPVSNMFLQYRIWALDGVFLQEKAIATFMGRPPALSRRYLTIELPLDISDEEIMMDDIQPVLEQLDANGWNRKGRIYSSTVRRAFMQTTILRDEILELALGAPPNDISQLVANLRTKLEAFWNQLPAVFHTRIDRSLFAVQSANDVSAICQIYLSHLQDKFLLERIPHPHRDEHRLLGAARDMLHVVVTYWMERDRLINRRDEIHWFISYFGIPAASILAVDLWKQTKTPSSNNFFSGRSQIIQNLSLFAACLDWIAPTDGNYNLCHKVRKLIQQILDRVLAPSPSSAVEPSFHELPSFDVSNIDIADVTNFNGDMGGWFDPNPTGDWINPMFQF